MHIVIAQMSHETNTFSPVITDLARFSGGRDLPVSGQEAIEMYTDTASSMGGFIQAASEFDVTISVPIVAGAAPSGPVEDETYEYIVSKIIEAAVACDAIMLDLHGAMVTKSFEDGEGELLRRIRAVAPDIPIAVALDMHANIYPAIVESATVVAGYHTYPHVDMDSTGLRAGRALLNSMVGTTTPTMVWGNAPMLPHVMRQGTDDYPNKALQERVAEMEASDAVVVSLFTGFPHADIYNAGLSVIVVTDNDPELAKRLGDELLDQAWNDRQVFVYEREPLEQSVSRAKAIGEERITTNYSTDTKGNDDVDQGPILLLDHYDNTASGGTMDTTEVLAEILRQDLQDVAVFGFYDPEVVLQMQSAGIGSSVTVSLGAKLPMPALEEQSKPLTLTGRVKLMSDGRFPATVAMSRGLEMNMGLCGILSVGTVDIVVISRHIEPFDPGCFRALGIEPTQRKYLMLKSRIHYRVGFMPLVKEVVECAGVGVCTSDYSQLKFENVRRPIFPLDGVNSRNG